MADCYSNRKYILYDLANFRLELERL